MLDHIELELKGAAVREVITLRCASPKCTRPVVGSLHLAWTDGRHNLYYGCQMHLCDLEARHPRMIGPRVEQTFFVG